MLFNCKANAIISLPLDSLFLLSVSTREIPFGDGYNVQYKCDGNTQFIDRNGGFDDGTGIKPK